LPGDWTADWLAGFAQGLGEDAAAYNCPLLGGDTVKSLGPLVISITALGAVPEQKIVLREGVAADDLLYVTGTIGDAALGLQLRANAAQDTAWTQSVSQADAAYLAGRYFLPQPRLGLREALQAYAHAAMDISDGLAGDLAKLLHLTGMTAEVVTADVPLSKAARKLLRHVPSLLQAIMTGGDDYELLCAVPPSASAAFEARAFAAGLPVHKIGTAKPGHAPPVFKDPDGQKLVFAQASYRHF
jgi:thiamine-monophosphate kinase